MNTQAHTGQHVQGCISCYTYVEIDIKLGQAAEAYKSGLVPTRSALAKVKRLALQKTQLKLGITAA
jgi:hypothetical protein